MRIYLTDPTSHLHEGGIQNLGDIIIKDAICDNIDIPPERHIQWVPLDGFQGRQKFRSDILILAGANIISNNPFSNRWVWRPPYIDYLLRKPIVLFGVGWWQYQDLPDWSTQRFYRRTLLEGNVLHSVRDCYTQTMLNQCGIANVVNTGCPTMWKLPDKLAFSRKANHVVFTLTDYNIDREHDAYLVNTLVKSYERVLFFPQGTGDVDYLRTLVTSDLMEQIHVLERSMRAYNSALESQDVDYVGTRLHAGIRALQKGRRAVIISVDNRATEIGRDTDLPIVERKNLSCLEAMIETNLEISFKINREGIKSFKAQLAAILKLNA